MTNRTQRLKASLFAQPREISLERALLYTASHRQTEGEPVIIRRAKATAWILDKVMISIREDELIAGNRTVKPRAGIMSPEMDPYWLLNELDAFPTRPQDRFAISEEDKQIYRETLYPYWEKRSMKDFINGQMTEEVKAAVNTQIFSVNQTDKGQGHIIIDYPRLLNYGLGALVSELKTPLRPATGEPLLSGGTDPAGSFPAPYSALRRAGRGDGRALSGPAASAGAVNHRRYFAPQRAASANGLPPGLPAVLVYEYHSAIRIQRQLDFTRTL